MAIIDGYPATSFDAKDRTWVKAVADNSAGEVLPDTTEASAGDVLTLNEDGEAEWKPSGGSSSDIFIINVTPSYSQEEEATILTWDKTAEEIESAYNENKILMLKSTQQIYFYGEPSGGEYELPMFLIMSVWQDGESTQEGIGHPLFKYATMFIDEGSALWLDLVLELTPDTDYIVPVAHETELVISQTEE